MHLTADKSLWCVYVRMYVCMWVCVCAWEAWKMPNTVNYSCAVDEFVVRPKADVSISPADTTGGVTSNESELVGVLSGVIASSHNSHLITLHVMSALPISVY